jgi:hypothetical protein
MRGRRFQKCWKMEGFKEDSRAVNQKLGSRSKRLTQASPKKTKSNNLTCLLPMINHQCPVFFIEIQGSLGGNLSPFCSNSIEILSGVRTNAICPSRGGRLITTPLSNNF